MAIMFRCACGKVMQAKEEFAGKKVKCSECGKVLLIPTPPDKAPAIAAGPPPAPPPRTAPLPPPPMESREGFQAERPAARTPAHWEGSSLSQHEAPWDPEARRRREP